MGRFFFCILFNNDNKHETYLHIDDLEDGYNVARVETYMSMKYIMNYYNSYYTEINKLLIITICITINITIIMLRCIYTI